MKLITKLKQKIFKPKTIAYQRFVDWSKTLPVKADDLETIACIIREFYPTDKRPVEVCVAEFYGMLTQEIKYNLKLDLNFEKREAIYFITADLLVQALDLTGLYNHLTGKNVKEISTQMAEQVKVEFFESVAHFKEKYEWIYNPPMVGDVMKATVGHQLRREFQDNYGSYAEITYLIACGDAQRFEEVNNMTLENYLSLGEYLLRKRTIESIE